MIRRAAAIVALALVAACGADVPMTSSSHSVALAIDSVVMQAGDSVMPSVVVTVDGAPRVPNSREIMVSSSDTSVIVVAPNDALIAVNDGSADITVAWAATPSVSVTRSLRVTSERLTGVSLVAPVTMIPGDTMTFVVTGTIRGGRVLARPASVVVTSRNPSVVTTNGDVAIAVAPGAAWIVATASTGVSDSSFVTVAAGTPAYIVISPQIASLVAAQTLHATVTITDRRRNAVTFVTPSFSSSASSIATVQPDGTVTAQSAGTVLIIASAAGLADTLHLTVTPAPPTLARLVVFPDSVTLVPGGATPIAVQALDGLGNAMTMPALTWQSLTAGITVSSAGVIGAASTLTSAISNGAVRVSSGSIAAQVRVAVILPAGPPPPSDNGYVQIRWVGTAPSAAVAAAFEAARTRINGLFVSFAGVTSINPNIPADLCMGGAPALNETINGIVLFAQVTPIDGVGNILGSAGPCIVRSGRYIPIVGTMQFDSADLAAMVANGSLNGVVLHEMMHTLGFGTIWGPGMQNEVASPSGTDPRYFGTAGQSAYAALAPADAPAGVPVENTGGSGTRGSHWRESVFQSELMTGWADGAMQLSRVTIGALKDFGYDVDLNKADSFSLSASLVAALRASQQLGEQTTMPIGVVGTDGRITPFTGTTGQ
jgi:Leishmanolysin